jgi:hypothetical protein
VSEGGAGAEVMSMALFSFSDEELAEKAVEAGRVAWDGDLSVFAHKIRAGISSKNDVSHTVSLALSGIANLGWRLHSVTPLINTIGPNNEEVWMIFERSSS